ncbi:MAG: septation regulator SpoVG [Bacilli bacterium]|nr:septation regulator SpoVG [Bacilli bacterium]MBO7536632.1 septation regulator SpoVG [Bacilli bacterium]MBP5550419.1 septation regulator SpoVG [Bacilli bacterium]
MEITDVRIRKIDGKNRLVAVASITFDACFVVHEIKIIQGDNGLFITMPSHKCANGEYKDIAHPIEQSVRDLITEKVLNAYEVAMSEENNA